MEKYEESTGYLQHIEHMKSISDSINALHSTILSLYVGLQSENVQQQALHGIRCIGVCVKEIGNQLDNELSHYSRNEEPTIPILNV
uniref:hypothetical protein n=1 Tax=Agathobacter sp. TaxID=2021311 RepID=UPI0040566DD2